MFPMLNLPVRRTSLKGFRVRNLGPVVNLPPAKEIACLSKGLMKIHMGVSKDRGTPKWTVYNGKPYFLMDDLGVPLFLETSIYGFPY